MLGGTFSVSPPFLQDLWAGPLSPPPASFLDSWANISTTHLGISALGANLPPPSQLSDWSHFTGEVATASRKDYKR